MVCSTSSITRSRVTLLTPSCSSAMTGSTPLMKSSTMWRASARGSPVSKPRSLMANRLLDRQVSLLEYLTSGQAIFGDRAEPTLDQPLQEIDRGLLHLEARFSHEKRMEKIVAVFPKTFEVLSG